MSKTATTPRTKKGFYCHGCGKRVNQKIVNTPYRGVISVWQCPHCEAIQSHTYIYLGESYSLVLPYFDTGECNPDDQRYYDFLVLFGNKTDRRHGWYNPATKRITQVG